MKATVWTKWNVDAPSHELQKPKCIFNGEISAVPHKDDYIVVREGFAAVLVTSIIYDFVDNEVEIQTSCIDYDDEYGPCLLNKEQ